MPTEKLFVTTANQTQAFLGQASTELRGIREVALYNANQQQRIDIIELGNTSYQSLWNYVHSSDWQTMTMLHYIGHSSGQGIYTEGTNQQPSIINQEALKDLFSQPHQLRFVFLNSCCSQELANTILQAGVPYMIGTSAKINDNQAVQVAQKFYQILGNIYSSTTIEQAFEETLIYFKTDNTDPALQQSLQQGSVHRGGIDTSVDEVDSQTFLWQLYKLDNLTDAQRNWRLIPPPAPVAYKPTDVNECYVVTPNSTASKPFSFLLSYSIADQSASKELVKQIKSAFREYTVAMVWNDTALADADERIKQLTETIQQADFLFLLVNDTYLTSSFLQEVFRLTKERYASGMMVSRPIALLTSDFDSQRLPAGLFTKVPLPDDASKTVLPKLIDSVFTLWNDRVKKLNKGY